MRRFLPVAVAVLLGAGGWLAAQDSKQIAIAAGDVLCCAVVRNEDARLPYFLSYYRQMGIARFLFVDNGSTDETLSLLLAQPDVYTWRSPHSFSAWASRHTHWMNCKVGRCRRASAEGH